MLKTTGQISAEKIREKSHRLLANFYAAQFRKK